MGLRALGVATLSAGAFSVAIDDLLTVTCPSTVDTTHAGIGGRVMAS